MNKFHLVILKFIALPLSVVVEFILVLNFMQFKLLNPGVLGVFIILLVLIIFLCDGFQHLKYHGFEIDRTKPSEPVLEESTQSDKSINPKINTKEDIITITLKKDSK